LPDKDRADLDRSVTVVIASFNGEGTLAGIVSAALNSPVVGRVLVVDNNSRDASRSLAQSLGAEVVALDQNRGYGAACNEGLSRASTPWLAFCNQDIDPLEDMFGELVSTAKELQSAQHADVIVAPRLESAEHVLTETGHRLPSWGGQIVELLLGSEVARARNVADTAAREPVRCDWVSAACILGSTEALRDVGGFDASYFMYVEDVDLFERWQKSGRLAFWIPAAHAIHRGGRRPVSAQLHAIALTNWVRYFARTTGPPAALAISIAGIVGSLVRAIAWSTYFRSQPDAGAYRRMFLSGALQAIKQQAQLLRDARA
jgi:N-acetylglucosaminyl-diphospho-decaprenol L-rhamnosyltransferase